MSGEFDAAALERGYAFVDDCPEHLLADVVTLSVGQLRERVALIRAWRDALLAGALPAPANGVLAAIDGPIRRAMEQLGVARFCKQQPELVDALLTDIVASWQSQEATFASAVAARLRELEELERDRAEEATRERALPSGLVRGTGEGSSSVGGSPDESAAPTQATLEALRVRAAAETAAADRGVDAQLLGAWSDRVRAWTEIEGVFGDLGRMLGRGWDLAHGVLRQTGWRDLQKLSELIGRLPQLREVIQALGRLEQSEADESVAEELMNPIRRVEEEFQDVLTPGIPPEMRGVERSGEISRMLPVEASMLGHPKLRMLWHARRAERALLTYRVEGVLSEVIQIEMDSFEEIEGRRPRPERGPIISVIDTSGSMHGMPERVAKAIVLETLRVAHAERRRCYLYAFSGPGDVAEHELDLSPEGIGRLLVFLGCSFGGGTDPSGVMSPVVARLTKPDWARADVLLVSDGEFGVSGALEASVSAARDAGTRFHGVQIGARGRTGLHALCDPVHEFSDWATAGGWASGTSSCAE